MPAQSGDSARGNDSDTALGSDRTCGTGSRRRRFHRNSGAGADWDRKPWVTFTLRNGNGYPVRDIEISCAFVRRDGSHLTDRARTIHDTLSMKSRKTFARLHVGFVNVNADRAKCSPVTASRV
jgi:hypothetical protein